MFPDGRGSGEVFGPIGLRFSGRLRFRRALPEPLPVPHASHGSGPSAGAAPGSGNARTAGHPSV